MRKAFLLLLVLLSTVCASLLALEGTYRTQLIDTYRPELEAFNPPRLLADDDRQTLLVMGDSFTAGRSTYAGLLQDRVRDWRVINAGIGGSGVLQASYVARNRFARFRPTRFVYQVYVGNDLFDVRYPINRGSTPLPRTLYWLVANHLRVVGFVNYRLGQVEGGGDAAAARLAADSFAPERYDSRVRTYLRTEPSLLDDSIRVQGRRADDYDVFLGALEELVAYCRPDVCRASILVIPHVCQVDDAYVAHMSALGARLPDPAALRVVDYPFVTRLRERFASARDVQVLNPLAVLRREAEKEPVYYANDEHLNPRGQHVIADFLVEQLGLE